MPDDARGSRRKKPGNEPMGDDVYQPADDGGDGVTYTGDMENALDEPDYDETLDMGYSPPEKPRAVAAHGTTAREQRDGEPLDASLAEEVPDIAAPGGDGIGDQEGMWGEPVADSLAGEERTGRLAASDEPARRRTRLTARDVGVNGGAASAEEAAMHTFDPEREDGRESGREAGREDET
ncbi:DUF5709 domain-containing protein [Streptomyces sp. 6N223]|uniref:DUF5709 domain-containing protein n=1 Tax=Streptomyces sp. 6N223 TaxID=3457412 RepID=UPI003FD60020